MVDQLRKKCDEVESNYIEMQSKYFYVDKIRNGLTERVNEKNTVIVKLQSVIKSKDI